MAKATGGHNALKSSMATTAIPVVPPMHLDGINSVAK